MRDLAQMARKTRHSAASETAETGSDTVSEPKRAKKDSSAQKYEADEKV